jgi:microcystin-dependent protein
MELRENMADRIIKNPNAGGQLILSVTDNSNNEIEIANFNPDGSGSFKLLPAGLILPFGGATPPAGWLACDGAAVSRTTYADLFATLSTNYGVGDGSTTFNLPDMRGEFIRGADNGRNVDTAGPAPGPRALGTTQAHQYGEHGHPLGTLAAGLANAAHGHSVRRIEVGLAPGATVVGSVGGAPGLLTPGSAAPENVPHGHPVTGTIGSSGGTPNSNETRPRNVSVNFIIKY